MEQVDVARAVARLGADLLVEGEAVAEEMVARIRASLPVYASDTLVTAADLRQGCVRLLDGILGSLGGRPDLAARESRENGRRRARAGMPLVSVMEAYRVGAVVIWERLADLGLRRDAAAAVLVRAASDMWRVQDSFTQAMAEGYREELTNQVLGQEQRRSALVRALVEGRLDERWEAVEVLRLPPHGPYVVVVAGVPETGEHGLPRIESPLRAADIPSAWLLTHDEQVGIAAVTSARLDVLAATLEARSAGVPVGVSPCFDSLADTPNAVRLARIAVRGSTADQRVVLFDRASLAVAAVSEPEVMRRLAATTLAALDGLPARERGTLLETFGVWLDTGSAAAAAARLFCHPNTVRYRLRRLEERTGRSLTDPRWVAELSLAYEVDRRATRA